jgi:hypothetical protein
MTRQGFLAEARRLGREGSSGEDFNALAASAAGRVSYRALLHAWQEGLQENPEYRSPLLEKLLAAR